MSSNYTFIGFPCTLIVISIISFWYIGIEVKKKRVDIKTLAFWIIMNFIFSIIVIYVLIIEIVRAATGRYILNIFNWFAEHLFAFKFQGQEWIILLVLGLLSFILVVTMLNTVKTQKLNDRIDELNKEVAVLAGKVNKFVNLEKRESDNDLKTLKKSMENLKDKVKLAKAKKRAEEKLKIIAMTKTMPLDTKSNSNNIKKTNRISATSKMKEKS